MLDAGAGLALDHHLLAEQLRHAGADHARRDVGRGARRKADDQPHRPVGVVGLRPRRGGCGGRAKSAAAITASDVHWTHCFSPEFP